MNKKITILTYEGYINQTLIAGMTEALEHETQTNNINQYISNNIFINFIELSQNIMKYSKYKSNNINKLSSKGCLIVKKDLDLNYYIYSRNIVSKEDKKLLEKRYEEARSLSKEELRLRYKELRKSGKNSHDKGGGIGLYEIAKRSDIIDFTFTKINEDRYYFNLESIIKYERKENA